MNNISDNKFISSLAEQFKNEERKKKEITKDANYINWLELFTTINQNFSEDDLENPKDIWSKRDKKNIQQLQYLFEVIDDYSKKNYMYPNCLDCKEFYNIKSNNVGFEIGVRHGQGSDFFCNRIPVKTGVEYIDFKDILRNTKKENTDYITSELNKFSEYIIKLKENNIPLQAIINTFVKTINDIEKELNDDKVKTKKRK